MTDINVAIKEFELVESHLDKLDEIWSQMAKLIPDGLYRDNGSPDYIKYQELKEKLAEFIKVIPPINGLRLLDKTLNYDEIGEARIEIFEYGMIECEHQTESMIYEQTAQLRQYRKIFNQKRTELVAGGIEDTIAEIDKYIANLDKEHDFETLPVRDSISSEEWPKLTEAVDRLAFYMGSSIPKPTRWSDLNRHMHFGLVCDLNDIINMDWPDCRQSLIEIVNESRGPAGVDVRDLADYVDGEVSGTLSTALSWENLSSNEFERLVFQILTENDQFQSVDWLMKENAPDKGRDISAERLLDDGLSNPRTNRIIIQCKHWLSRSVPLPEITNFLTQIQMWEPPAIDEVIIATSGRFTPDAVEWIESHNQNRDRPYIQMWPESKLETFLASSPGLISDYGLR